MARDLVAVLDTSVLYPLPLCDTLLRLAERELYRAYWSERILEELHRTLLRKRGAERADHRLQQMREAFPEAVVPSAEVDRWETKMATDEKDRHVLATAVAGGADMVVTLNLKHFPEKACAPYGIEAVHPDEFLVALYAFRPSVVKAVIAAQVAALRRPEKLINKLREDVPEFALKLGGS